MLSPKYKVLKLKLDGNKVLLPTIGNSYLYTLWVLNHKYKDVKLYGTYNLTYEDKIWYEVEFNQDATFNDKEMTYNIPETCPFVDVNDIKSIIVMLGVDAVLILYGEIYDKILNILVQDLSLTTYTPISTYFDDYIISLQIESKKINGGTPLLNGINYYKYTNRKRKSFNRRAETIRLILNKETNIERKNKNKYEEEVMTDTMREYYESQLHDFVYTYIYKGKTSYDK